MAPGKQAAGQYRRPERAVQRGFSPVRGRARRRGIPAGSGVPVRGRWRLEPREVVHRPSVSGVQPVRGEVVARSLHQVVRRAVAVADPDQVGDRERTLVLGQLGVDREAAPRVRAEPVQRLEALLPLDDPPVERRVPHRGNLRALGVGPEAGQERGDEHAVPGRRAPDPRVERLDLAGAPFRASSISTAKNPGAEISALATFRSTSNPMVPASNRIAPSGPKASPRAPDPDPRRGEHEQEQRRQRVRELERIERE